MTISFADTAEQAGSLLADGGEILAGGTDLSERLRSATATGPVVDISRIPGLDRIEGTGGERTSIGALVSVATIATNDRIVASYPALAATTSTIATPQIRTMATLGGVLCQRTRCPYARHPRLRCFKNGGDSCPARDGSNHFGVAYDLGPCAYPHPSSVALSMLAYDATVTTNRRAEVPIAELYGDGTDPTRDHLLGDDEIVTGVTLPPPTAGERSAYVRLMGRSYAEWPTVECVVRIVERDGVVETARICLGAVANIPIRVQRAEAVLHGHHIDGALLATAAAAATFGAEPVEQALYKVAMIEATVLEALELAIAS